MKKKQDQCFSKVYNFKINKQIKMMPCYIQLVTETFPNFRACWFKLYKKINGKSEVLDRNAYEVRGLLWKYSHVTLFH